MHKQDNEIAYSSLLAAPVAIGLFLLACVVSAFVERAALAAFFGFVFTLLLCSYAWGRFSVRKLTYAIDAPSTGVFPGQTIRFTRTLHNQKLLPLIWIEVIEPYEPYGCAAPESRFVAGGRCVYKFSMLRWHQKLSFTDEWAAVRRGVHSIDAVSLRSGDGLGLCVRSKTAWQEPVRRFSVYPKMVDVSVEKVLRDMWETCSASCGYLEDVTLLRSVREYLPSDPAKRINQRLLARGQGLMVNRYETAAPGNVLFVLDAASFAGKDAEHFEEALSIAASLIMGLCQRGIRAGIAVPASMYFPETFVQPSSGRAELLHMLELLSAADQENPPLRGPLPVTSPELIGQTYYVAHNFDDSTDLRLLAPFPAAKVRLLLWNADGAYNLSGLRAEAVQNFRRFR